MIKRLMFLVLLLAVGVVGYGFYAGWFAVTTQTTPDGKTNTTVTIDKEKMKESGHNVAGTIKNVGGEVKQKTVETVEKIKSH
jgi:hypothetical protein